MADSGPNRIGRALAGLVLFLLLASMACPSGVAGDQVTVTVRSAAIVPVNTSAFHDSDRNFYYGHRAIEASDYGYVPVLFWTHSPYYPNEGPLRYYMEHGIDKSNAIETFEANRSEREIAQGRLSFDDIGPTIIIIENGTPPTPTTPGYDAVTAREGLQGGFTEAIVQSANTAIYWCFPEECADLLQGVDVAFEAEAAALLPVWSGIHVSEMQLASYENAPPSRLAPDAARPYFIEESNITSNLSRQSFTAAGNARYTEPFALVDVFASTHTKQVAIIEKRRDEALTRLAAMRDQVGRAQDANAIAASESAASVQNNELVWGIVVGAFAAIVAAIIARGGDSGPSTRGNRGILAGYVFTLGILAWFVATNAGQIPPGWIVPGLALGAALYATLGKWVLVWVHQELRPRAQLGMLDTRVRWENAPDALALTAIATYVHTWSGTFQWALTFALLGLAFFVVYPQFPIERRTDAVLASGIQKVRSRINTLWASHLLVTGFMILLPAALFVLVVPVMVFHNLPSAFPMVASGGAWALGMTVLLATLRVFIGIIQQRGATRAKAPVVEDESNDDAIHAEPRPRAGVDLDDAA